MAPFLVEQTSESFSAYSASRSVSKIPISCTDPSGSFHMLKPGIPWSHFENAASMSLAVKASSSFAIEADPDDLTSVQFRIPSASAGTTHDRIAFYISGSGEVGFGTKDPETAFDIRDVKQDIDPKLAKTNKQKLLLLDRTEEAADFKAHKLKTARTIGGVSFDGSANINLPGVNTRGNQDTTGTAADATILETARTIGGVPFNGSANINLPGVNARGSQDTTGKASTAGQADYATKIGSSTSNLTFTVSRTNLIITDGTSTWTIAADR